MPLTPPLSDRAPQDEPGIVDKASPQQIERRGVVQPLVLRRDTLVGKRDGVLLGQDPVGGERGSEDRGGNGTATEGARGGSEHGRA